MGVFSITLSENFCFSFFFKFISQIAFCMTLTDPLEIRQYLTAYLGSSNQVNNFATDFISRKGGGNQKQEEWESANAKKGRNKKKGSAR